MISYISAASLFFAFSKASIPIIEMRRKTVTLEDVFLQATDSSADVVSDEPVQEEPIDEETVKPVKVKVREQKSRSDDDGENYRPLFK